MPPKLQRRQSPHMAGPGVMRKLGGSHHTPAQNRIDGHTLPALLRYYAGYLDVLLIAICEGERISLAGRQVLALSADRLRQIAGALE